ncbi:MAG: class I SAM-dependent methyltransferase [Longimicrobiales bacterium]|nr:class I SAM-dependent methyltransferase [Longimicrobiales bacterium]
MSTRFASTGVQGGGPDPVDEAEAIARIALFVIWAEGRHAEDRILADLEGRFTLIHLHEITWSPRRIMENYRRFYSDLPVRGVYHTHAKGRGAFLAAVVRDETPVAEERMTSRGRRTLNARFLDAKLEYRRWAGELTIHSTETPFETERDLTMLFGVEPGRRDRLVREPPDTRMERMRRDLTGAGGWASEAELFEVLNRSVRYVVTGAPGAPPEADVLHLPEVNLLTDDYLTLHTVLNPRPRLPWPRGGRVRVRIGGRWVEVGVRFVGDGFYPSQMAERLLEASGPVRGGRRQPPAGEDLLARAYQLCVHDGGGDPDQRRRLDELAARLGVERWPDGPSGGVGVTLPALLRWLEESGVSAVEPQDPMVDLRAPSSAMQEANPAEAHGRGRLARWRYRAREALRRGLVAARDQLLYRIPAIRRLKRLKPRPEALRGGGAVLFAVKRAVLLARGLLFLGWRYRCPCCGWPLRSFVEEWALLASNRNGYCPRCNAKARHRRLWLHLRERTDLLETPGRVLEIAPWWAVSRRLLGAPDLSFVGLDLANRGPHVTVVGDATAVPLASDCFDWALFIHTLEHIERDRDAIRELHRVLKPGGWAIVSVPLDLDAPTYEDPTVTDPADRAREFGERSHVRLYGLDLRDRLHDAGFDVTMDWARDVPEDRRRRFGLREDENLFVCRKTAGPT